MLENGKEKEDFFTSYWGSNESLGKSIQELAPFYSSLVTEMMSDLGLEKSSRYSWTMWAQMYNSTTGSHGVHQHFGGLEIISWVHFLQVPLRQDCFYFQTDHGKIYPTEQKQGNVVAFPAWRLHGVDPVQTPGENRLVIAGNISLNQYSPVSSGSFTLVAEDCGERGVIWTRRHSM